MWGTVWKRWRNPCLNIEQTVIAGSDRQNRSFRAKGMSSVGKWEASTGIQRKDSHSDKWGKWCLLSATWIAKHNETWSYRVTSTEFEIAWNDSMKLHKNEIQDLKIRKRNRSDELLTTSGVNSRIRFRLDSQLSPQLDSGHQDTRQTMQFHKQAHMYQLLTNILILLSLYCLFFFLEQECDGGIKSRNRKAVATHLNSRLIQGRKHDKKSRLCKITQLWWPH